MSSKTAAEPELEHEHARKHEREPARKHELEVEQQVEVTPLAAAAQSDGFFPDTKEMSTGYTFARATSVAPSASALATSPLAATVTGTGFATGATVELAGVDQATTFVSATSLTCTLVFTTKGPKNLRVRSADGQVTLPVTFTVT